MKKLTSTLIALATIFLVWGYSLQRYWTIVWLIVGLGLIWLAGQQWNWRWATPLGFVVFAGLAGWGVWLEVSTIWLLLGTIGALTAWDLSRFSERLAQTTHIVGSTTLKQTHFRRLQIAAGLSLLLGIITLESRFQLNFGWAILLSLLMTLTLAWAVGLIRRTEGK
jgi:hypothetical protein